MLRYSADQWQDPQLQSAGIHGGHAASLLMTLLYPSRMCRPDLQFPVTFLARFITRWSIMCDMMLHRLFCYLWSTVGHCLVCTVGHGQAELDSIEIHGFPDADHGDCPLSNRSTSGNGVLLRGNVTSALTHWSSKRQGCTSTSTPEAEIVSACKILREYLVPIQSFWSLLLKRTVLCILKEDNEACIKILISGYSLAMRHIERTHKYNLSQASEILRLEGFQLEYCPTDKQLGDFLTKALDKNGLQRALLLAGLEPASKPLDSG